MMACNLDGGCRVCPGMWLAGVMILIMLIQTWLLPAVESKKDISSGDVPVVQSPEAIQATGPDSNQN